MTFQVLQADQQIHGHRLLEASAGTGKTFTIQHLVVRLLLFPYKTSLPLTLPQILVVTFTKKAASELKERIYRQLSQTIEQLQQPVDPTHYLFQIQEGGQREVDLAMRRLQEALFSFERASIGTIHSFCLEMLQRFSHSFWPVEKTYQPEELCHFLSLLLTHSPCIQQYSPFQLQKIMQFDPDQTKLLESLLHWQKAPVQAFSSTQAFPLFCDSMQQLQTQGITCECVLADFTAQLGNYYAGKESKKRLREKVEAFATLLSRTDWNITDFDSFLKNGTAFLQALDPSLQKTDKKDSGQTSIYKALEELVVPLIQSCTEPKLLLSHLAEQLLPSFARYQIKYPCMRPDDLLEAMQTLVLDSEKVDAIRCLYHAAIIDEFQDTDPMQWQIFQQLFLGSWSGSCYFVGDPKQSIYSFRKADIYTYLQAGERLGEGAKACLTTNFRSSSSLIDALNILFSPENLPHFFPLPKKGLSLSCPPALSGSSDTTPYLAEYGPLHFWIFPSTSSLEEIEEHFLFPQIVQTLREITPKRSSVACLVKDRYQGEKLAKFLGKAGIPYHYPRPPSLTTSRLLAGFQALVEAVFDPRHLQKTLFSPLLPELSLDELAFAFSQSSLRDVFQKKGWSSFLDQLLRDRWLPDQSSICQHLLETQGGTVLWEEMQRIERLFLLRTQEQEGAQPHLLFENFADWAASQTVYGEEVSSHLLQILTIHASKGLEFDVVFPIGLLRGEKEGEKENAAELDAEKMRLLYVALTRAKKQLFVPYLEKPLSSRRMKNTSPMELFTAKFHPSFSLFLEKNHSITYTKIAQPTPLLCVEREQMRMGWLPEPAVLSRSFPLRSLTSFTQMQPTYNEHVSQRREMLHHSGQKNRHTLPPGRETGTLIHWLLKKIPLESWKRVSHPQDAKMVVAPFLTYTHLEGWEEVVGMLLWDVLFAELTLASAPFCLSQLEVGFFYQEMPFLYPTKGGENVQGVIDLCFMVEGKYYLVDWKTNWLGDSDAAYAPQMLEKTVQQMGYGLQAELYKEALERYFALFEKQGETLSYGASFFLFLRGMERGSSSGIYKHK